MKASSINLREERNGRDVRRLWATLSANGDLQIEGQDLGPSVGRFWGQESGEYEWCLTIRATDVEKLVMALGATPGEALLPLLAERFKQDEDCVTKRFLEAQGIPVEFWSRVGD